CFSWSQSPAPNTLGLPGDWGQVAMASSEAGLKRLATDVLNA
ncbi:MAG: hypothetical protein K0Q60_4546, partial [Microvirga sp.]|nr:hypothetical protein [Microvirga sp.]